MGEIPLRQTLEEFKTIYMPARNLGSRTRKEYYNDLDAFIAFLEPLRVTRVGDLGIIHVDRYLAKLDEQGYSGSTRKRKAITFRSFLSFLFRNGYLGQDISRKVVLPFSEHPIPRVLTQTEYQKLLSICSGNPRNFALITLLLQTGIRLSELTRLQMSDLHFPESIDVRGAGSRKGRTITLNPKVRDALQGYISIKPVSTTLFLSQSGKPLGNRGVEMIINKYYRQANIQKASVRTLRHTFGVQHLIKGTSLKTVQKTMGHQDIRTTEGYIQLANVVARKEMEEIEL